MKKKTNNRVVIVIFTQNLKMASIDASNSEVKYFLSSLTETKSRLIYIYIYKLSKTI